MKEFGKVVKIDNKYIYVNITDNDTNICQSCLAHNSCPFYINKSLPEIRVLNPNKINISIGEQVEFEVPKKMGATKMSLLLYGFPLLIFVVGIIILINISFGTVLSLMISLLATFLYYFLINLYTKHNEKKFIPYIIRKME